MPNLQIAEDIPPQRSCAKCGDTGHLHAYDSNFRLIPNGPLLEGVLCWNCSEAWSSPIVGYARVCDNCHARYWTPGETTAQDCNGYQICGHCAEVELRRCDECGRHSSRTHVGPNGSTCANRYCETNRAPCAACNARGYVPHMAALDLIIGGRVLVCGGCNRGSVYPRCIDCGRRTSASDAQVSANRWSGTPNAFVCESCIDYRASVGNSFTRCAGCESWHHSYAECNAERCPTNARDCAICSRNYSRVNGAQITIWNSSEENSETLDVCYDCGDNYTQCDYCYMYSRSIFSAVNGYVCARCIDNDSDWEQCSGCGDYFNGDSCGNYDCRVTASSSGPIHYYSYKPRAQFHGNGPLFLGPEIEIETRSNRRRCAEIATDHLGNLGYLKEDGSIRSGFEIVTHPMSFDWAMSEFPWDMFGDLSSAGAYADENCGIHIHVSRAGFASELHTYKWIKFVYRNADEFQTLARRRGNHYASFTNGQRAYARRIVKGYGGVDRYSAINANNEATLEMRIFASTLDAHEIKSAFGLAAASVEYTRTLTASEATRGGWQFPAFADWVAKQDGRFDNLSTEIGKRIK